MVTASTAEKYVRLESRISNDLHYKKEAEDGDDPVTIFSKKRDFFKNRCTEGIHFTNCESYF